MAETTEATQKDVLKAVAENAASTKALLKLMTSRLPTKEDLREQERNKDEGNGVPEDEKPEKRKGILKRIGGLFGFLGNLGKSFASFAGAGIGKLFTVLKFIFKAFGGIALFVVGAAATAFLNSSPEERKKMIDSVMSFVGKVGTFLKTIGSAFAGGFLAGLEDTEKDGKKVEGLGTKLKKMSKAFSGVFDKIANIEIGKFDGKTYTGIAGIAELAGGFVVKLAGFFVDFATGVANLITDPATTIARIQVKIEDFFLGIGASIGRVFEKFTDIDFFLSLLPSNVAKFLGFDAGEYADKRARKKLQEIEEIDKRSDELESRRKFAQKKLDDLGDKATNEEKRKYTLMIERSKNEIERGEKAKKAAQEVFEQSQETVIKEKAAAIVKRKSGVDTLAVEEEIKKLREKAAKLRKDDIDPTGFSIDASLGVFKQLEKLTGGKNVTRSMITTDFKNQLADLGIADNRMTADYINEFLGAGRGREEEIAKAELQATQKQEELTRKTAELMPAAIEAARKGVAIQYGADFTSAYLPESGTKLNALQMERVKAESAGKGGDINAQDMSQNQQNNSTTIIQNEKRIGLPGEGTDALKQG